MSKYVYLTSSGYSGSTLLAFMLGSHPRIASIGELSNTIEKVDPDNYRCSCRELIKNCLFWKRVSIRMQEVHKDFSYKNFGVKLKPKGDNFLDQLQFLNLRNNIISDSRDYIYKKILQYCKTKYRSCPHYFRYHKKRYFI